MPASPASELMVMILPLPCLRMCGRTARIMRTGNAHRHGTAQTVTCHRHTRHFRTIAGIRFPSPSRLDMVASQSKIGSVVKNSGSPGKMNWRGVPSTGSIPSGLISAVATLGLEVAAGLGATVVGRSIAMNNRTDIRFLPITNIAAHSRVIAVRKADSAHSLSDSFLEILRGQLQGGHFTQDFHP